MKINKILFASFVALALFSCKKPPPSYVPVSGFDLNKYAGVWYEIARLPTWFEKGLDSVTATYSLNPDGTVKVLNQGVKNGKRQKIAGKARFAGRKDEGYLEVSFFGPFYAEYIIVDLPMDYSYALVTSGKDYLWILSRLPVLEKETVDRLVEKAKGMGFETGKLYWTKQ